MDAKGHKQKAVESTVLREKRQHSKKKGPLQVVKSEGNCLSQGFYCCVETP